MTITLTISTLASIATAVNAADVTTPDNELLAHINNMLNGVQEFDALRISEIATPSNPAATKHKLYFKTDGFAYTLDSSGIEQAITQIDIVQYQCFT